MPIGRKCQNVKIRRRKHRSSNQITLLCSRDWRLDDVLVTMRTTRPKALTLNVRRQHTEYLCREVLKWLFAFASKRDVLRFSQQKLGHSVHWTVSNRDDKHSVFYLDANRGEPAWRPVLEQATEIMSRQSVPSQIVSLSDAFGIRVNGVVPWELKRMQIAKVPKSRRLPYKELSFTSWSSFAVRRRPSCH